MTLNNTHHEVTPVEQRPEVPVFIVRSGVREFVAVRDGRGDDSWVPIAREIVGALLGPIVGGSQGSVPSARRFVLDEASLDKWDSLTRHGSGGFSYGTLWGADGRINSQIRLREVGGALKGAPASLNPMMAAELALVLSLKTDIARLENAIEAVQADVASILRFLEVEQEASVLAALATIHAVHATLESDGMVTLEDWDRVVGLEHVIKTVERQILSELATIADAMSFRDIPAAKHALKSVSVERIEQLKLLLHYVVWAQAEWTDVMIARKASTGSLREAEIEQTKQMTAETRERALGMLQLIDERCALDASIQRTDPLRLLFRRGLIAGRIHEQSVIDKSQVLREQVKEVVVDRQALESSPVDYLQIEIDEWEQS